MSAVRQVDGRAAELRAEFDRTFAAAPTVAAETADGFLVIAVAGDPFLLRLSEIAGLFVDRRIVPVPGADAALLGITGLRGVIVPVYRLGTLLGYPPADAKPRWLAVAAGTALAVAFDRLDHHLEMARTAIVPRLDSDRAGGHVDHAAMTAQGTLPIVDLASVAAAITANRP